MDTGGLNYSINKNIVWGFHITIGLFFVAIAAVYLSYKDKDENNIPINIKTMNEGVYVVILMLGSWMILYHGHLMVSDQLMTS